MVAVGLELELELEQKVQALLRGQPQRKWVRVLWHMSDVFWFGGFEGVVGG